ARRPRRLRGRPARLRRAAGALLPVEVSRRPRPALARPAGPDVHRPRARAPGRDVHRRAGDRAVRRHAAIGASMRIPRSNTAIGLVALAVVCVLLYLGFTKAIPLTPHYEIKAAFASANNIRPGSPVRIAGVEVGKVTKIERANAGGQGAILTLRINKEGRPIHDDATAKIRPRIFLEGNFFVDMTSGSPSAPEMKDGQTIPVQQTATPVQLDQVVTALQSDTRKDLKILLREYGKALDGAGAKGFNRSIPYWEPAYRDGSVVADAMRGETGHDLSGYVKNAGATAAALDRNGERLKSLVTDFNTTAAAFASQDDNLG